LAWYVKALQYLFIPDFRGIEDTQDYIIWDIGLPVTISSLRAVVVPLA
jgi:hypothetical protein